MGVKIPPKTLEFPDLHVSGDLAKGSLPVRSAFGRRWVP